MHRLEVHILYHDTDSIIYTYLPHQLHPEMGTFLGELTDELTCKNVGCEGCVEEHWIVEFISCGAKNYALADLGEVCLVHAPPMGPISFIFAYIFTKKCPCQRSMPPLMGACPPLREIVDSPLLWIPSKHGTSHV